MYLFLKGGWYLQLWERESATEPGDGIAGLEYLPKYAIKSDSDQEGIQDGGETIFQ